jgi:hypothetical protein
MKFNISNKKEFIGNILNPISCINDKTVIKIEKDKISSITAAADGTLILHSEFFTTIDSEKSINIPDIKKLIRVFESVDSESLELEINSNNIKYASENFKFTYHLLEDGIIKSPSINVKKINDLKFDMVFTVKEEKLTALFKGSSFTTETNKLYIFIENNKIYGELGDKSRHNSDNFQCTLADKFEGTPINKVIPINFDTFRLINFNKCSEVEFSINVNFGVVKIVMNKENTKLTYIVSALVN